MLDDQRVHQCWTFLDRVRGILEQGWFYVGAPPGRSQSETRTTECSDFLGLVAELCGDCQRMGEALAVLAAEATALELTVEEVRKFVGVDLAVLSRMHLQLSADLSAAGSRALDTIGESLDATTDRRTETTDTQCLRSSADGQPG